MWLECNCLMFLSPCICLCSVRVEKMLTLVRYFLFVFLVRSRSCFSCPLVVGIFEKEKKEKKKDMFIWCIFLFFFVLRNLLTLLPPSLSLSPSAQMISHSWLWQDSQTARLYSETCHPTMSDPAKPKYCALLVKRGQEGKRRVGRFRAVFPN